MTRETDNFRAAAELLPDGVFLFDPSGRVQFANRAACDLLGCTPEQACSLSMSEIDSRTWADLLNESDLKTAAPSTPPVSRFTFYRRGDNTSIPVEVSLSRIKLDGEPRTLTTVRKKQGQDDFTRSQKFLGRTIENSLIEVFVVSETTLQMLYVNRGARENSLYSPEELHTMRFPDICRDISEDSFYLLTSNLAEDEQSILKIETELTRKDKTVYPVLLSIHKSHYLSTSVCIIQAIDISEKARYKEDVDKAYDIINRSSSIAFVWQNDEGFPVSFVSKNVGETFGYQPEDFLVQKKTYLSLIHPEDLDRVEEEFGQLSGDTTLSSIDHEPYRIITAEGKEKWVKANTYVQRDREGDTIFFRGIVEDITDLKRHEEELFKSNRLMEKTFQSISDIVLLLDPEFRIIKINKAGRLFLDRPLDEILGSKCSKFFPDTDSICDISHEVFDTKSLQSEEVFLPSLNRHFIVSYAPIFNDSGEVIYIVNVLRDITENKLMEEKLFLTEKMTTIASLAAGVSHEINTPLSAILQSIQVIQMGFAMEDQGNREMARKAGVDMECLQAYLQAQEIDFFIEGIKAAALNASKIITTLLNFSRPQKGDRRQACVNELIDNSLQLARADYNLKKKYDIINIPIDKNYTSDLPDVLCIPMEIEQVILNLIKNAVHALAGNPPDISPKITIRTFLANNRVLIHFEDNGPGIDQQLLSKIFDPFYTTKDVGVGTGLGLSLAYTIIHDKHNGNIFAESDPGGGTRFVIELPPGGQENLTDTPTPE